MVPILVAYGTVEGQSRKIAEFIAERLRVRGHSVDLIDTATPEAKQVQPFYRGAILGGSVHQGEHPAALTHFLHENQEWLSATPCAFFSVSLSAALDDPVSRAEVRKILDGFVASIPLHPVATRCVAGALKYTKYDYFKRIMLRLIAEHYGKPTDTSNDYEYTDWEDLEMFVDEFLAAARIA